MKIEVSLRIPNMKVRAKDENGYPLDNSTVRFRKIIEVEKLPKPGDSLHLDMSSGRTLGCEVVRTDWHEERGLFVAACQYANKSIQPDEYAALVDDPSWEMKPLV